MRTRLSRSVLFAVALLCTTAASAAAQDAPKTDLSVGYQFTHLNGTDDADGINIPAGWTASLSTRVTPIVGLVGEVNGSYKDGVKLHNYLGGVRLGGGPTGGTNEIVIAGQLLAGLGRIGSMNALVIQPGLVVDVRGESKIGARFNVDYNINRANGATDAGIRVAAGVVFDLGR